jgi:predicted metalloprotease with PDZ domain
MMLMTAVFATVVGRESAAQVRIETGPGAFAYVIGDPDRPMIGISTRSSGKRDTLGLLVESVTRGGPAEKAGIEEGDRLVAVNSVNLRLAPSDAGERDMDGIANRRLIRELEKQKAGADVELRVYRDGNTRTVRVTTVAADELNSNAATSNSAWRRLGADRAVLGISLGGSGSRRDTSGILIVGVTNEGPAAKAGIDEGDRVASINGVDLRVAREDAGDWQASSVRINRLNREMEKVNAGDAVELRVYSAGQVRTVRVEAAKAADVHGDGFFFGGSGLRTITVPRGAMVRPPSFNQSPMNERNRIELENRLRSLRGAFQSSLEPQLKLRDQLRNNIERMALSLRNISII